MRGARGAAGAARLYRRAQDTQHEEPHAHPNLSFLGCQRVVRITQPLPHSGFQTVWRRRDRIEDELRVVRGGTWRGACLLVNVCAGGGLVLIRPLERLAVAQLRPAAGARGRPLDAVREGRERLEVELELPQPVEHAPVLGVDVGGVVVVRRRERLGLVRRERVDGAERDEHERGEAGEHGGRAAPRLSSRGCLMWPFTVYRGAGSIFNVLKPKEPPCHELPRQFRLHWPGMCAGLAVRSAPRGAGFAAGTSTVG